MRGNEGKVVACERNASVYWAGLCAGHGVVNIWGENPMRSCSAQEFLRAKSRKLLACEPNALLFCAGVSAGKEP